MGNSGDPPAILRIAMRAGNPGLCRNCESQNAIHVLQSFNGGGHIFLTSTFEQRERPTQATKLGEFPSHSRWDF